MDWVCDGSRHPKVDGLGHLLLWSDIQMMGEVMDKQKQNAKLGCRNLQQMCLFNFPLLWTMDHQYSETFKSILHLLLSQVMQWDLPSRVSLTML